MKKVTRSVLLVTLLALLTFNTVYAQDYSFRVEKEIVQVYWNKDGTMSLDYTWDFVNQSGAHPIDFVDVGMPNPNFDISTAKADVNGNSVSVSRSDYQGSGSGFAVVMGSQTIPAGGNGEVHVYVGSISNVLYNDEKDQKYASAAFAPTYFGSQYVVGNTDLTVIFHLPPNIKPEEPRWHDAPLGFTSQPQTGVDQEGRITYTWQNTNANAYTQYQFGASFPKTYIPTNTIVLPTPISTISTIPTQTQTINVNWGQTKNIVGGWLSNFLYILIGAVILYILAGIPFLRGLGIPIINGLPDFRRKLEYLPPKISIEGHGIKRGLTAVEAAILMEQSLDKVMTMILFGIIKKNAAQVTKRDPLEIKVADPLPEGLYQYEIDFLKAFNDKGPGTRFGIRNFLENMTVNLVNSVSEKMRGFSRKETIDYYKSIMEKAWQEVEQANTPEVKGQKFDENLEWTMLDRNYDDHTRRVFTGPIYVPTWWNRYDPNWKGAPTTSSAPSMPSSGRGSSALPGADFAASVVGGVQTFSQKVIGNISDFTSRVTNLTNPPPAISSDTSDSSDRHSGGWGGGGHSCACACACAGCACACAGGGR